MDLNINSTDIYRDDELEKIRKFWGGSPSIYSQGLNIPVTYTDNSKVAEFNSVLIRMTDIFKQKNKNYGNSFDKTLDEDGLIVAKIRLSDKLNRFSNLIKQDSNGTTDESLNDTLLDLANYAILTIMWLERNKNETV